MFDIRKFRRDRKSALISAIMRDDWSGVKTYCKKYAIPIPQNEKIMKAGIYKSAQELTDLPDEVKMTAYHKCVALGFKPYITED